jgi:hypothetical protein
VLGSGMKTLELVNVSLGRVSTVIMMRLRSAPLWLVGPAE